MIVELIVVGLVNTGPDLYKLELMNVNTGDISEVVITLPCHGSITGSNPVYPVEK